MLLDAFLANLPNCVNREMIDSAAAEFCLSHNTKNNRKKLVKYVGPLFCSVVFLNAPFIQVVLLGTVEWLGRLL